MGSMVWDHGSNRETRGPLADGEPPVELAPLDESEIVAAFGRWWRHGATRQPGHESFNLRACMTRFIEGWRDSESYVSDFKRRGMPHENGERSAYMAARFLSSADRMARRRLIRKGFGDD